MMSSTRRSKPQSNKQRGLIRVDTAGTLLLYYVHRMNNKEVKNMKTSNPIGQYRVNIGDIGQSIDAIDNMDDLNKVIDMVRQKQKGLRAELVASKKSSFSVGMKVKVFTKGDTLIGTIKKLNRTKAVVNIKSTDYNVPMSIMEVA
jgi:hypothetical protein